MNRLEGSDSERNNGRGVRDLIGRNEYVSNNNANKRIIFYTVKWIIIFIRDSGADSGSCNIEIFPYTGLRPTKYPTLICIKGLPVT